MGPVPPQVHTLVPTALTVKSVLSSRVDRPCVCPFSCLLLQSSELCGGGPEPATAPSSGPSLTPASFPQRFLTCRLLQRHCLWAPSPVPRAGRPPAVWAQTLLHHRTHRHISSLADLSPQGSGQFEASGIPAASCGVDLPTRRTNEWSGLSLPSGLQRELRAEGLDGVSSPLSS